MELKTLQEQFIKSIAENHSVPLLEKTIIPGGKLTVKESLDVYRGDYRARMKEALSVNFEATWLILGDEEFFRLADLYISKFTSNLDNLTNYGEFFPEFIKEESLEASQMAEFEKAFWNYFHAKDRNPLNLTAEIVAETAFDLSNLTLMSSELRLDLIWQNREAANNNLEDLNLYEACYFVLFKKNEKVEIEKITQVEYEVLIELKECLKICNLAPREILPEYWARIFSIIQYA